MCSRHRKRGALHGLTAGSLIVVALLIRAVSLSPPGGEGEPLMWFLIYATLWGLPTSIVVAPICLALASVPGLHLLAYALLVVTVPANWTLMEVGVGGILGRRARRLAGRDTNRKG